MPVYRKVLTLGLCSAWLGGAVIVAQSGQPAAQPTAPAQGAPAAGAPAGPRPLDPKLLNLSQWGPNRADEPFAKTVNLDNTRNFLDQIALNWTRDRQCGTCHNNIPYMIGRAMLGPHTPAADEVRAFFVDRAERWDAMGNQVVRGDQKVNKGWGLVTWYPHEIIVTAIGLAMDDLNTTGHLAPITRQVLDRLWTQQRQDGGFYWLQATSHPYETSEYLGNAMAAVAVAMAPDDYANTPAAKSGLKKLSNYLREDSVTNNHSEVYLHDRLFVLWAASHVPTLISPEEREEIITKVLALQKPDGGWSLPSLGNWRRADGTLNDVKGAPSDGYGTGLVTWVLLQTGRPANDPVIEKAVHWLKTNQRESGRWFTRSPNKDTYHFVTHIGTVYSAMALRSVGTKMETDQ